MDSEHLLSSIKEDLHNNLLPKIVFATAGTTDIGIIDPIDDIS
jgi:glutamate/tyrosine decarboxylase-like PLP-dependent enzyme